MHKEETDMGVRTRLRGTRLMHGEKTNMGVRVGLGGT